MKQKEEQRGRNKELEWGRMEKRKIIIKII
jgi:hypothetical protein